MDDGRTDGRTPEATTIAAPAGGRGAKNGKCSNFCLLWLSALRMLLTKSQFCQAPNVVVTIVASTVNARTRSTQRFRKSEQYRQRFWNQFSGEHYSHYATFCQEKNCFIVCHCYHPSMVSYSWCKHEHLSIEAFWVRVCEWPIIHIKFKTMYEYSICCPAVRCECC